MGLDKKIVIVNEFTCKTKTGGSRGSSPGKYVSQYMNRPQAVEMLGPAKLANQDAFIRKYMLREQATERHYTDIEAMRASLYKTQGYGGISFGRKSRRDPGSVSFSDQDVREVSREIQELFDQGHTVLKTVLSFDTDYLKERGIIPQGFRPVNRGDFKGQVDQGKLRLAIMAGMGRLGKRFDDLEWIGVIQVDTLQVHCHLCMVDRGVGLLTEDGQQKGKLSQRDMGRLRRGIDNDLDLHKELRHLSSNVAYDRQNVRTFVKKYTHRLMAENGTPQLLLACLPENKNYWRAGSNRKDMRKANRLLANYVQDLWSKPESGYKQAMVKVRDYADERARREGLSLKAHKQLIDRGEDKLLRSCMDGIYSILKDLPEIDRTVQTPLLDLMALPQDDLPRVKERDPMVEFTYRLRTYKSRMDHHKEERKKYKASGDAFKKARDQGETSPQAEALNDFYEFEDLYQTMLMAKYQYLLPFLMADGSEFEDDFMDLMDYRDRVKRMNKMVSDKDMRRMTADKAEAYGLEVYGLKGGQYAREGRHILTDRRDKMEARLVEKNNDLEFRLEEAGLALDLTETGGGIKRELAFDFGEVKALDLHRLKDDFSGDARISQYNIDRFVNISDLRYHYFEAAKDYLVNTGQEIYVKFLPEEDVLEMKALADRLKGDPVLKSDSRRDKTVKHKKTVPVDPKYGQLFLDTVSQVLQDSGDLGQYE